MRLEPNASDNLSVTSTWLVLQEGVVLKKRKIWTNP
jgi:hypothetical protein